MIKVKSKDGSVSVFGDDMLKKIAMEDIIDGEVIFRTKIYKWNDGSYRDYKETYELASCSSGCASPDDDVLKLGV